MSGSSDRFGQAGAGVLARLVWAAAFAVLSACGPRAVDSQAARRDSMPRLACLEALGRHGTVFTPIAERAAGNACRIDNAVALRQSAALIEPAATLACPMALAWAAYDAKIVQPAARRHFGRPVRAIQQIGAYSCRFRTGTRKLSQHAFGHAIDVAAFEIDGGMRVSVKDHWRARGARGRFLRKIARGACAMFSVVLTPSSDRDHADHLHFDIGPDRLCGA